MNKGLEVARGKTKVLYENPGQPDVLVAQALDTITSGDGARSDEIPGKGRIAAKTTARVFRLLNLCGLPTHYLSGGEDDDDNSQTSPHVLVSLPSGLTGLSGLWAMGDPGLAMVLPIASNLKKLDLKFTLLSTKAYCQLFSLCHSLEELQVLKILSLNFQSICQSISCKVPPLSRNNCPSLWQYLSCFYTSNVSSVHFNWGGQ